MTAVLAVGLLPIGLADSEYSSHWKKADVTAATFRQLVDDTVAAFEEKS